MRTTILTHAAAKDLDSLPVEVREGIAAAIDRYATRGEGDIKRLAGRDGFRMRLGSYRVIFLETITTITVVYVGRRSTTTYR